MKHERQDDNEVPEYVPTRRELKQLAVYWAVEYIANRFWWFVLPANSEPAERWERDEALIHLNRMGEILGSETMEIVWRDAEASFRKRGKGLTDEDWRVFAEGTEQEREAWRDKVFQRRRDSGTGSDGRGSKRATRRIRHTTSNRLCAAPNYSTTVRPRSRRTTSPWRLTCIFVTWNPSLCKACAEPQRRACAIELGFWRGWWVYREAPAHPAPFRVACARGRVGTSMGRQFPCSKGRIECSE